MRLVLALAAISVLLLPAAASAVTGPGVKGIVKVSPGGMCLEDDPCDGVGRHVVISFTRLGKTVKVRSGADGRFQLRLASGRYRIGMPGSAGRVAPQSVLVPAVGFAAVTVALVRQPVP